MPYVRTADTSEIWYETTGDGRPLVFVPGIGMTTWHWQRQLPLAQDHRVVTFDPRGQGRSSTATELPTLGQVAADLHAIFEELDLHDAVLVGWSMGAFVVFEYLAAHGVDRIAGLCTIDMTPCNHVMDDWPHAVFGNLDAAGVVAGATGIIDDSGQWLRDLVLACFAAGSDVPDDVRTGWEAEVAVTRGPTVLSYWLELCRADWRELMPTVSVPTLLAHGGRSLVCPTDVGTWMRDAIPQARLVTFDDSGHAPFWEEPEKFNAELDALARQLA